MKELLLISVSILTVCLSSNAEDRESVIWKDGFENGLSNWTATDAKKQMLLDNSKYTEGTKSLLLPESITLESVDIKISPSTRYCISLKSWSEKSGLFYIHAQELDKDKNILNPSNSNGTSDTMWEAKKDATTVRAENTKVLSALQLDLQSGIPQKARQPHL